MLHFFAKRLRDMQEVRRDERGFTLIELLVVIIIIGILAAIAIPTFLAQRTRSWEAAAQSDLRNAAAAATTCASANNGSYATCTKDELVNKYDLKLTDGVELSVAANIGDNWGAEAKNTNGGATYAFTTFTGKVKKQP